MAFLHIVDDIEQPRFDNIHGMLVGVALGDALGHPHEFKYQHDPYTGKLQYSAKHLSQWTGTKYAAIGQFTDDTEMTLALAHSLIKNQGYVKDEVILSYQEWANHNTLGMGVNTRLLLKNVKTVKGYQTRYDKAMKGTLPGMIKNKKNITDSNQLHTLEHVKSNGSLMRSSPLALLTDDNCIITDVNITNPNDINRSCSILYIDALRQILSNGKINKEPFQIYNDIREKCKDHDPEIQNVFAMIDNQQIRDVTINKGYVVHSFYCAMLSLQMLSTQDKYSSIIDFIINLGGDTDTNAAIAGAIVGAYLGFDQMMTGCQVTKDNYDIMITMNPDDGDFPVNEKYRPDQIKQVSIELSKIFG